MKFLVAVIVLVVLGGGVWVAQRGDSTGTTDETVKVDDVAVDVESGNQNVNVSSSIQAPESQPATAVANDVANSDDPSIGIDESASQSPFSTVAGPETVAEPNPSDSESASSVTDTSSADKALLDNTEREPIVVPQSYPVTEAAKYFIPKGERGPGRLGGPPPLDFPGGPSDPDNGDAGAFDAPSAPGN